MKGHIRRRGQRSWAIVLDIGRDQSGKRQQKWHAIQGTKKDAERELTRLLSAIDTGVYAEPTRLTVGEHLTRWLDVYARSSVAPKTYERYAEIIELHLIHALGHHILSRLQPLAIQTHYSEALRHGRRDGNGGLSAQTVLHHHRVLHKALAQAVRWRLIAINPASAVDPPRPARKQVRTLNEAETGTLMQALEGGRLHAPALLALTTGLRRGELLALRWQDVEASAMVVCRSIQQTNEGIAFKTPKSGRGRTVALPEIAVALLRKHKASQAQERLLLGPAYQDHDLVFPRPDGRPWEPDSFTSTFASSVRRVDMRGVNFHSLRHSHATILLGQGVNPKIVSERLGHAKVSTTLDVYSHVLPGMQEEAARRIDAALGAVLAANS